ncbi:SGNH/GDSL hydrolase family protein [Streptomyces poriferorum]|uniref:SGNH/GDSL hydrolase family protein n=1 Tax=Streptomyces poriferorum TaxID=2798799 RepID=A0ABY9J126_9ACTN|nr:MULTISPECIES: SGNH/GDSL hydrolase family protein [unclassified Streptomyces]MDP5310094.1 SGNH/GDSL hydrolase family protein [Streptomyces sp. Alt4]WLQ46686.1 SGNH/GDSL hydrolase family protein [Streptomyces sp. Alt1]WLQ60739.1 SGNH/GDSL hydrolase family protein [Streptomyces sp. Alt2]WSI61386.1 SGNH/GDSL hydrolase family protein [Streptomyces sp. NBC_01336]
MPGGEYLRYVALGDSQTEGVGDGDDMVGLRGWADRLAEHLTTVSPGVQYANLAVRGRVAGQVRAEQLEPALALRPDLATVVAGVNDLLRPRVDVAEVAGHLEEMFAALTAAGAQVATLTIPDVAKIAPVARPVRARVSELNTLIRAAAARHGVAVAEIAHHPVATDRRLWSVDRLHASPLGHARIAAAVAQALDLPRSDDTWTHPLPPQVLPTGWQSAGAEVRWAAGFLGPWLGRRLRGRSSGDGRTAKRPHLLPLSAGT